MIYLLYSPCYEVIEISSSGAKKFSYKFRCLLNLKDCETMEPCGDEILKSNRRHAQNCIRENSRYASLHILCNERFVSTGSRGRIDAVAAATWKRLLLPPRRRRSTASKNLMLNKTPSCLGRCHAL